MRSAEEGFRRDAGRYISESVSLNPTSKVPLILVPVVLLCMGLDPLRN